MEALRIFPGAQSWLLYIKLLKFAETLYGCCRLSTLRDPDSIMLDAASLQVMRDLAGLQVRVSSFNS